MDGLFGSCDKRNRSYVLVPFISRVHVYFVSVIDVFCFAILITSFLLLSGHSIGGHFAKFLLL